MPDYSDFTSMSSIYDFSKGPKSLYYAKGDEDLFAVVLNVPQRDDDDEWGGTERVALERVADEIGTLQEWVLNPGGGGADPDGKGLVSHVLTIETMLNILTRDLAVNNGVFSGDIVANEITAAAVNATALEAGTATVCGSLETQNIVPDVTLMRNIGTPLKRYNGIAAVDLNLNGDILANEITVAAVNTTALVAGTATICGTLTTRDLVSDANTRNIGTPSARYNAIAARDINLGDTPVATFTVDGTTGNTALDGTLNAGTDIYTEAWTNYSGTTIVSGWTSVPPATTSVWYRRIGKMGLVEFALAGNDGVDDATTQFTLPTSMTAKGSPSLVCYASKIVNAGAAATCGMATIVGASNVVTIYPTWAGNVTDWDAGVKSCVGTLVYELT